MNPALETPLQCPPRESRTAFAKAAHRLLTAFWRNTAGTLASHRAVRIDPDRWSDAMLRDIGLSDLKSHRRRGFDRWL